MEASSSRECPSSSAPTVVWGSPVSSLAMSLSAIGTSSRVGSPYRGGVSGLMWWIRHTEVGYYANVVGYYA